MDPTSPLSPATLPGRQGPTLTRAGGLPTRNGASPRPPGQPPRRVPRLVWLGVLLLAASGALAYAASRELATTHVAGGNGDAPATQVRESGPTQHPVAIGYVDVRPGVANLYPLQPGTVVGIEVKESQKIDKAGVPLLRLDDTLARAKLDEAQAALKAAQITLDQARTLPQQHRDKVAAQKAVIDAKQHQLDAARDRLSDVERLSKKNLIRQEEVSQARQGLAALESSVEAEKAKLHLLETDDPQRDIDRARQDVKAKEAKVQEARYGLDQCTLKSPGAGEILRIQTAVGETLGPNPRQAAVLFLPAGPRVIRAEVEQEFARNVHAGQAVRAEDDSTAEGGWTGRVAQVSDWYTNRRSIIPEPLHLNDVRTLEVLIELDTKQAPNQPPLRIGQRMRVKFLD